MTDPELSCAVYVPSWDGYGDLWRPFVELFRRFWPDCPYPLYLGANAATYPDPSVRMVFAPQEGGWSSRVRGHVEQIPARHVLLILEDCLLRAPVVTADVERCVNAMDVLAARMIRLVPNPKPDVRLTGVPWMGALSEGAPYRASTMASIWRRETLLELLRPGESIWEFEVNGSVRSTALGGGFFCTWTPVLQYGHNVVEKGKWFPWEARRYRRLVPGLDLDTRPVMNAGEASRYLFWKTLGVVSGVLPLQSRLRLAHLVRR